MAKHSISEASRLTGRARSTIHKHINDGKISKELDKEGNPIIDTSELVRAYGPLQDSDNTTTLSTSQRTTPKKQINNNALHAEIEMLKQEKITLLEKRIADLEGERDDWKKQAEQAMRLLTDQRSASETPLGGSQKPVEGPYYHLGWFDRVLGRKALRKA